MRANGRGERDLRPLRFTPGFTRHAEGSVLVEFGETRVLCTASVEDRVPPHRTRRAGDFFHRLAAYAQPHQQRANLGRRRGARHDQIEGRGRFRLRQRLPFRHPFQEGFYFNVLSVQGGQCSVFGVREKQNLKSTNKSALNTPLRHQVSGVRFQERI